MAVRNLVSAVQKHFLKTSATLSPSSPLSTTPSTSFTVQFLVNSCGLSLKSALLASQKIQLDENKLQKPQSVLNFLKAHDFNDTHIANLISDLPKSLYCRVENNLKPKFEFLMKCGFVGQLLPQVIVSNRIILKTSLDRIKPGIEILKSFLNSNENIVAAFSRCSVLLTYDLRVTMQPNVDFLVNEGVPFSRVEHILLKHPRMLVCKHDKVVYAVNAVKSVGLEPNAPGFIHAVRVLTQMSEATWKKKMELLKSFGLSEAETMGMFKAFPLCLASSEEKLRRALDFYLNTMKLEVSYVISHPVLLMYAIDKRIHPRYVVLKVLESNKLLESKKLLNGYKNILWWFTISEKNFFEKFVRKYQDKFPLMLETYKIQTR